MISTVIKRLFIGLSILACLTLGACSFTNMRLYKGEESFRKQNYRDAFIRLKPLAEKGNAMSQYAVGYMYYYGFGVVEDKKVAMKWIKKAAIQGQPDAIRALKLLSNQKPSPYKPAERYRSLSGSP